MHLLQRVQSLVNVAWLRSQGGRNSLTAAPPPINLRLEASISCKCLERRSGRACQQLRDPDSEAESSNDHYRQCRCQDNGEKEKSGPLVGFFLLRLAHSMAIRNTSID